VTEFLKKRWVLGAALGASIIAYLSAGWFPDPLAFGPMAPMTIIFALYPIAAEGGWLAFIAVFIPLYFAICTVLSLALLVQYERSWEVSVTLFTMLALGNTLYFLIAWQHGIKWQGSAYTWTMLGLNIVVAAVCAFLFWRAKQNPRKPWQLFAAHSSFLFWLSWISFPYLGELI